MQVGRFCSFYQVPQPFWCRPSHTCKPNTPHHRIILPDILHPSSLPLPCLRLQWSGRSFSIQILHGDRTFPVVSRIAWVGLSISIPAPWQACLWKVVVEHDSCRLESRPKIALSLPPCHSVEKIEDARFMHAFEKGPVKSSSGWIPTPLSPPDLPPVILPGPGGWLACNRRLMLPACLTACHIPPSGRSGR